MKTAMHHGREIGGDEGVDIRESMGRAATDFRCPQCGKPVRVMRAGGKSPSHFEHHERNDHCSLVHQPH